MSTEITTKTDKNDAEDDASIDPIAEKGLASLYNGATLDEAAKEQGIGRTTLVRHLVSNPTYEERYARAMIVKGVIYAEEIVSIPDSLPDDPTPGELARAKMRVESRQWTATKFWQHLNPQRLASANLGGVNAQAGSTIVIQAAPVVNNKGSHADGAADSVIDLE